LVPALKKALALKGVEGYARTFVIATDGYVDVEKETFDLIRSNLGNASFFAFGIGTAVNRYIIEGMARVGNGEPFIIEQPEKAEVMAERLREYIQTPVLTNIKVTFPGFSVYDAEPVAVPSLYADRPLLIYGKYRGKPSGKIEITGKTGEGNFTRILDMNTQKASSENLALKYLWARNRIMLLDDYGRVPGDFENTKKEVLNLGLKYNLLTAYTSFIAIDSEVRNNTGKNTTVTQPLPLPEGVNNNAIGYAPAAYGTLRKQKMMNAPVLQESVMEDKLEVSEEKAFSTVEEPARFQGGDLTNFVKWVQKNLKMPQKHIAGTFKVYAMFTVDETGKITDVKIVRGVDPELDNEVIRVLKSSPLWEPAKQSGNAVKQNFTIPVEFTVK
jgi:Ca-activated chloride channel family protein